MIADLPQNRRKKNIRNLVNKLNVNLVTRKSKNNIQVRLMKENAKLNSRFSPLHILKDLCNGCSNGYKGGAFRLAKEKGIPLIFFGDSKMERSVYKKEIFKGIEFRKKAKIRNACYKPINFMKRRYYNHLLEIEFPFAGEDNESVTAVHLFDYIQWDEKQINETIKKLGWISGSMKTTW